MDKYSSDCVWREFGNPAVGDWNLLYVLPDYVIVWHSGGGLGGVCVSVIQQGCGLCHVASDNNSGSLGGKYQRWLKLSGQRHSCLNTSENDRV